MSKIHGLVTGIIEIVILAAIISGFNTTFIDALNVTFGPITSTVLMLMGNLVMGLVLVFASLNMVRTAMGKKL